MERFLWFLFFMLLVSCNQTDDSDFVVTVTNSQTFDRVEELVEVPINAIANRVTLIDEERYIILDPEGNQVPYQITYDDNLLFPATVKAGSEVTYTVSIGEPIEVRSFVYGRHYPERLDDMTWENDRLVYRAYGPASQAENERNFGYDVWVKCVPEFVAEQRYTKALDTDMQSEIARLRKARKYKEANLLYRAVSYDVEHGDGLDSYEVGPTLGCGTTALVDGGAIFYPYCWNKYEIMESGPLRFTVKLTYNPFVVGKDSVIETRIISLEKGSQLNRTIVTYAGLTKAMPVATGLVVHSEYPTAYALDSGKRYIAYADPTGNVDGDHGVIYVGAVMANKVKEVKSVAFTDKEAKERGASGHVLAVSTYKPEDEYIYYWGAGWSRYGFGSMNSWADYLDCYAKRIHNPLRVEIH